MIDVWYTFFSTITKLLTTTLNWFKTIHTVAHEKCEELLMFVSVIIIDRLSLYSNNNNIFKGSKYSKQEFFSLLSIVFFFSLI